MSENTHEKDSKIFSPERLCHIGIVVKDIDETIKYYERMFGCGPLEIRYVDYPTATYYGKVDGYRGKRAFFFMGPVQIELIELVDGKTIHEDFLREKGEGLHHLGFWVDNIEESRKRAEELGYKVIQSYTRQDSTGFAYFDSDKIGGVLFEIIEKSSK
jgi:methylmalonyl-CoA/ethylmalonyl-CoA epimerase